jgi:hypothetical protein
MTEITQNDVIDIGEGGGDLGKGVEAREYMNRADFLHMTIVILSVLYWLQSKCSRGSKSLCDALLHIHTVPTCRRSLPNARAKRYLYFRCAQLCSHACSLLATHHKSFLDKLRMCRIQSKYVLSLGW